ncbi:predicted protein [Arabidopsis lyrata subsp. lyrata]|uniref:Predicted protein n=1 Tax=Arabidopsis lyrata subsp. lyrata TaxID=81972 RepID=D7LSN5_ARALL|nr:predicted protein [Arabidopsis lyrata subsp. lyrata]
MKLLNLFAASLLLAEFMLNQLGIEESEVTKNMAEVSILNLKSWTGEADDSQPEAVIAPHAVAVHTRLQENEGILVKYHTMKARTDGDIVSIRISQQLLC